jgi:uncharacterized protein YlxP (DUF503 family)
VSDDPTVWIGVLTFDVLTPGARSLKEKRSLVRPIVERTRSRFEVAVARLDGLDRLDRETLGVSVLSSDAEVCRRLLERAHDFAASFGLRLEGTRLEVERWS